MSPTADPGAEALLIPAEAAELLRLSPRTLEKMRTSGSSLKFVRLGRRCLYDLRDVRAYIEANKFTSTAEADHRAA